MYRLDDSLKTPGAAQKQSSTRTLIIYSEKCRQKKQRWHKMAYLRAVHIEAINDH